MTVMRRIGAALAALLVAATVVVPAGAGAQYFCRMMGQVTADCCCKAARTHGPRSCAAQVERSGCCELRLGSAPATAPAARDAAMAMPGPAPVTRLPLSLVLEPSARALQRPIDRGGVPPPTGPPPFLRNCVILT
jgi:hypothetical protein